MLHQGPGNRPILRPVLPSARSSGLAPGGVLVILRKMSRASEMTRRRLWLAPSADQPSDGRPETEPPVAEPSEAASAGTTSLRNSARVGRSVARRRSLLLPRSLIVADLVGLGIAFLITTMYWGHAGAFGSSKQLAVFCATLPCWLVVAKFQGLYRADHERADHSTTDDLVGVFYLVTAGVWVLLVPPGS